MDTAMGQEMNLQTVLDLFKVHAGGTSEGAKKAWDTRGRGRHEEERPANWRSFVAKSSYVAAGRDKQEVAEGNEKVLAEILGGRTARGGNPFDVEILDKKTAVELKTKFPDSKNERINLKVERRLDKGKATLDLKLKSLYTVAFDSSKFGMKPVTMEALKSGEVPILVKSGTGAFNYKDMKRVTPDELRDIVHNHKWVYPGRSRGVDKWGSFKNYIRERGWEKGE